jgi:hypothetical protein
MSHMRGGQVAVSVHGGTTTITCAHCPHYERAFTFNSTDVVDSLNRIALHSVECKHGG